MPPRYIKRASDLETSHAATVEGFRAQSFAKTVKASAYVAASEEFRSILGAAKVINSLDRPEKDREQHAAQVEAVVSSLLANAESRDGIIGAAGLSQKAREHLTDEEIDTSVRGVLATLTFASAEEFRRVVHDRYLLTEGDALGGQMRNYVGAEAGQKLTGALIDALKAIRPAVLHLPDGENDDQDEDNRVEHFTITKSETQKIIRLAWDDRMLLFDVKPALIGKNIDVILLDTSTVARPVGRVTSKNPGGTPSKDAVKAYERVLLAQPDNYLACGELKGGIDPAGADEHWKTARSALDRIGERFPDGHCPPLFFVAAAIQHVQASEIFTRLQNNKLTHAANLTVPKQVRDLAEWLVAL